MLNGSIVKLRFSISYAAFIGVSKIAKNMLSLNQQITAKQGTASEIKSDFSLLITMADCLLSKAHASGSPKNF